MVAESSSSQAISVTLRVWRQAGPDQPGRFVEYPARNLNPHLSFLEMLDVVNDELTVKGEEPIAFDHDCHEGICGNCSLVINGKPHGPHRGVASCQTYLRSFHDGDVITVEPLGQMVLMNLQIGGCMLVCLVNPDTTVKEGEDVHVAFPAEVLHFFDPRTEENLLVAHE